LDVLEAWSLAMPGLNDLKLAAINQYGVLDSRSVLVVAPTGSGKTMIGELAAMRAVADGSRAVMLLPLKALVNDKFDYMSRTYGGSVKTVRATGDISDQVGDLFSGQYDVALLTYEKFKSLMLGNPHIMRGLSVVVVDEVQTIGDAALGPDLELLLTLLRSGHGRLGPPQIVALSAVIGDTRGFERWLGGGLLRHLTRPVPLRESVIDAQGGARHLDPDGSERYDQQFIAPMYVGGSQSNKPWVIPLVRRLVSEGKKVIVFRATRGDTVGAARYLAETLGLVPAADALGLLPSGDRSSSSEDLRLVLQRGVAFHNSDLDREERYALESTFRRQDSPLRVIVATTTLAMGVNTPAEAVVIAGLRHPGGSSYSIAEYKNMAGRAGRLGHAEAGEAYIIATSDLGPGVAWTAYVNGQPEAIASHFLASGTDPQTLVLSCLVALGSSVRKEDLVELLENSFAMWLRQEPGLAGWNVQALRSDLEALITAGLVDREPTGVLTLTALGRYAGESGLEVRSVTLVASALRFAPPVLGSADAIALAQVTCELDQLYIPANRRSRKEQQRWPMTLPQLGVSPSLLNGLHVGGGEPFIRIKRAVACLLFMSPRPMAEIERILLQHTRDSAAAGNIRQVAARTRDVIDAVIRIAIFNGRTVADDLDADDVGGSLSLDYPLSWSNSPT
jgi:replicative superfamily II helicase